MTTKKPLISHGFKVGDVIVRRCDPDERLRVTATTLTGVWALPIPDLGGPSRVILYPEFWEKRA